MRNFQSCKINYNSAIQKKKKFKLGDVMFSRACNILTRISASFELDSEAHRTSMLRVWQDPDLAGKDGRN